MIMRTLQLLQLRTSCCITSTDYNGHYCLASNYRSRESFFLLCLKIFSTSNPPVPLSSLSFVPLSAEHFKGPKVLCLRPFCPLPLLQSQNIRFNPAQANLATCSLTFMTCFVLLQNITSIMTSHKCAMFTNRHQLLYFWSCKKHSV